MKTLIIIVKWSFIKDKKIDLKIKNDHYNLIYV